MKITNQEYGELIQQTAPKTHMVRNCIMAFLVGGAICTVGQGMIALYQWVGLDKQDASTATTISLIFLGGLLTAFKVYDNIAKFAGAGTLVPITGFANSIVSPAIEFKSEGMILGLAAKMFVIAGPVLVYGSVSAFLYGVIIWFFGLF